MKDHEDTVEAPVLHPVSREEYVKAIDALPPSATELALTGFCNLMGVWVPDHVANASRGKILERVGEMFNGQTWHAYCTALVLSSVSSVLDDTQKISLQQLVDFSTGEGDWDTDVEQLSEGMLCGRVVCQADGVDVKVGKVFDNGFARCRVEVAVFARVTWRGMIIRVRLNEDTRNRPECVKPFSVDQFARAVVAPYENGTHHDLPKVPTEGLLHFFRGLFDRTKTPKVRDLLAAVIAGTYAEAFAPDSFACERHKSVSERAALQVESHVSACLLSMGGPGHYWSGHRIIGTPEHDYLELSGKWGFSALPAAGKHLPGTFDVCQYAGISGGPRDVISYNHTYSDAVRLVDRLNTLGPRLVEFLRVERGSNWGKTWCVFSGNKVVEEQASYSDAAAYSDELWESVSRACIARTRARTKQISERRG